MNNLELTVAMKPVSSRIIERFLSSAEALEKFLNDIKQDQVKVSKSQFEQVCVKKMLCHLDEELWVSKCLKVANKFTNNNENWKIGFRGGERKLGNFFLTDHNLGNFFHFDFPFFFFTFFFTFFFNFFRLKVEHWCFSGLHFTSIIHRKHFLKCNFPSFLER